MKNLITIILLFFCIPAFSSIYKTTGKTNLPVYSTTTATKSNIVGELPRGQDIENIMEVIDGWGSLVYNGDTVYVQMSKLEKVEEVSANEAVSQHWLIATVEMAKADSEVFLSILLIAFSVLVYITNMLYFDDNRKSSIIYNIVTSLLIMGGIFYYTLGLNGGNWFCGGENGWIMTIISLILFFFFVYITTKSVKDTVVYLDTYDRINFKLSAIVWSIGAVALVPVYYFVSEREIFVYGALGLAALAVLVTTKGFIKSIKDDSTIAISLLLYYIISIAAITLLFMHFVGLFLVALIAVVLLLIFC